MNKMGYMHGSKETAKGRAAERKHSKEHDFQERPGRPVRHKPTGKRENPNRYQPTGLIRGLGGERHRAAEKSKKRKISFAESLRS